MDKNKVYINLGCGNKYDKDWINVDFNTTNKDIIQHHLLEGIPFNNNSVDFIYCSHLLEHFTKPQAEYFLSECFRVLKKGAYIRVVVPDLEYSVKEYLKVLEEAYSGDNVAQKKYEWIIIELLDQMVRSTSGGEMRTFFVNSKNDKDLQSYVNQRIGFDFKSLTTANKAQKKKKITSVFWRILKKIFIKHYQCQELRNFAASGELHKWMYDKYSLKMILEKNGFKNITQFSFNQSNINNWDKFYLDNNQDNTIYKPDSLYMEAQK